MNRTTLLFSSDDLTVRRFDHPPHASHHDDDREVADAFSINFVLTGAFDVVAGSKRHEINAGKVFLTHPELVYRVEHGELSPTDVCLSVVCGEGLLAEGDPERDAFIGVARRASTAKVAFARGRLSKAVADGDKAGTERWALAAVTALADDTVPRATRMLEAINAAHALRGPYRAHRADLEAMIEASRVIERAPETTRSVSELGALVHRSGAQLTRLFRRFAGTSPHNYQLRLRLAHAADLLSAGATVSDACYHSGFENLSYFCRTFKRSTGVTASKWRALGSRETRRKVQELRTLLR